MYLLEAQDATIPAFKDTWASLGDSIVVVGGDGMWNCHVHTNDVGGAIEAGIEAGRPRSIRVTDLLDQSRKNSGSVSRRARARRSRPRARPRSRRSRARRVSSRWASAKGLQRS